MLSCNHFLNMWIKSVLVLLFIHIRIKFYGFLFFSLLFSVHFACYSPYQQSALSWTGRWTNRKYTYSAVFTNLHNFYYINRLLYRGNSLMLVNLLFIIFSNNSSFKGICLLTFQRDVTCILQFVKLKLVLHYISHNYK